MEAPPEINVAEYIKNPTFCPWCKSDNITTFGPIET